MKLRPLSLLGAFAAFLVPSLVTVAASAQQVIYVQGPPPSADGARFRGGVGLEVGAFAIPGVGVLGLAGIQGQLGGQINNNWAVYAIPTLDFGFGKTAAVGLSAGVLAEYTLDAVPLSVGVGPEAGLLAAFSSDTGFGAAFYGARLHAAFYPVVAKAIDRPRRKGLYVGLDVGVLAGAFGGTTVTANTVTATAGTSILLQPMATIGYAAF